MICFAGEAQLEHHLLVRAELPEPLQECREQYFLDLGLVWGFDVHLRLDHGYQSFGAGPLRLLELLLDQGLDASFICVFDQ